MSHNITMLSWFIELVYYFRLQKSHLIVIQIIPTHVLTKLLHSENPESLSKLEQANILSNLLILIRNDDIMLITLHARTQRTLHAFY